VGPQSRPGRGGEEKNPYPGRPSRSLVSIMTELSKFLAQLYKYQEGPRNMELCIEQNSEMLHLTDVALPKRKLSLKPRHAS
jgi:hypothetical protein